MTKAEARKIIDTGAGVVADAALPWLAFAGALLLLATWAGFGFFWFLVACAVTCLLIAAVTFVDGKRKMVAHIQSQGPLQPSPEEMARADYELLLATCHVQFTYYADQHKAKGTPDGDLKAKVNTGMANRIEQAFVRNGTHIDEVIAREHERLANMDVGSQQWAEGREAARNRRGND